MLRSGLISVKNDVLNLKSQIEIVPFLSQDDADKQIKLIVNELSHIALDLDKSINETDSIQAAINEISSSLR